MSTVNYRYLVAGALTATTTAPTATQSFNFNSLLAQVVLSDADTTAALTHNWGLSATEQSLLYPLVASYVTNIGTAGLTFTFTLTDGNTVTLGKASAAGSGCTMVAELLRPNSLIR